MSRAELADAVNAAIDRANTTGRNVAHLYVSEHWVGKLERGKTRWPHEERRAALRRVFGATADAQLGLYSMRLTDAGYDSESDDGGIDRSPVLRADIVHGFVTGRPSDLQAAQQDILNIRSSTSAVLDALLPAGDLLQPLTAKTGRHIGPATVTDLAARIHRLRLADDVVAGGDLIAPAFRDLRAAIRLYRQSAHTEDTGRDLLAQIGELAQIAGWIASDAGRHNLAERAYQIGITAARQAGDDVLTANLAGSLAYQHANTGRERDAVELAHAAVEEAGSDAAPRARALFLDRLAWAHTQAGQAQPAMRALGEAHEALSVGGADDGPQWAYWVSQEELEVMDARVYTELHRPLRAVPVLSRVLDRYDVTHAREMALYLSWLAIAYADANEPEAAASTATRMLELSTDMASERTTQRAGVVLRRLAHFQDLPEVRTLLVSNPIAWSSHA